MKRRIKKLLYSSLAALVSIGINFNAEARVTREVAEAVLPYLMKAVGIPEDAASNADSPTSSSSSSASSSSSSSSSSSVPPAPNYSPEKQKAILNMIYTDEGQQQMVEWVKTGEFPGILKAQFGEQNTYSDKAYRDNSLAALFPCQPGGTFTSYATNSTRLGYCIHSNSLNFHKIIYSLLIGNGNTITGKNKAESKVIIEKFPSLGRTVDMQLAIIAFIIDISDTSDQILNALDLVKGSGSALADYNRITIENSIIQTAVIANEYMTRPISASSVEGQGDCCQNLFRHLIDITIQNHTTDTSKYNVGVLPAQLAAYYSRRYPVDIITVGISASEAGLVEPQEHRRWNDFLKLTVGEANITEATVKNIAIVLDIVSSKAKKSIWGNRSDEEFLDIALPTGDNSNPDIQKIQTALNKLDGRGEDKNHKCRFQVFLSEAITEYPWATKIIKIIDRLHKTIITIGIGEGANSTAKGHAEILKINRL